MNTLIVALAFIGCAVAQIGPYRPLPVAPPRPAAYQPTGQQSAAILKQSQDVNFDGNYAYSYETENGISVAEQGQPKSVPGSPEPAEEVQGQFSYTSPEGVPINLQYVSNENGFQPSGAHLPVPPPTPAAILRALEWIARNPQPEEPSRPFQQPQYQRRFK